MNSVAKITKAQRDFVNYFIEQDFRNAYEAYMKAYPKASRESARANAPRLLANDSIQSLISKTLADILEKEKIPLEKRIFDYWMKRAFYDITEIISVKGKMKLTEQKLRAKGLEVCIDSINKKTDARGDEIITYKFADKDKAADMLQRYIQMIKEPVQESKVELSGTIDALSQEDRQKRIEELLGKLLRKKLEKSDGINKPN
jgi:phage terminase small subunit